MKIQLLACLFFQILSTNLLGQFQNSSLKKFNSDKFWLNSTTLIGIEKDSITHTSKVLLYDRDSLVDIRTIKRNKHTFDSIIRVNDSVFIYIYEKKLNEEADFTVLNQLLFLVNSDSLFIPFVSTYNFKTIADQSFFDREYYYYFNHTYSINYSAFPNLILECSNHRIEKIYDSVRVDTIRNNLSLILDSLENIYYYEEEVLNGEFILTPVDFNGDTNKKMVYSKML